jgi:hypothetical protein
VYGADADPWACGDQRYADDAERWGETVGTADATDEATRLYEPRITANSQYLDERPSICRQWLVENGRLRGQLVPLREG